MSEKHYITAQALLQDSFRLAAQVYDSGFRPQFIVGIWRGGSPIGIAVQEYFEYKNVQSDHIAVRTSSYYGIGQQAKEIRVHGLHYLIDNANAQDGILVVDDVFDSGRSIDALLRELKRLMRLNLPGDIRIACPWYKPNNKKVSMKPDYYVHTTDSWLVFPHELADLTPDEIARGKTDLQGLEHLF